MSILNKLFGMKSLYSKPGAVKYIVAGLGNPGIKYENTRHNAGFIALNYISKEVGIDIKASRFHGLCGECELSREKVLLLKPQTFMNESGKSILESMSFYKVDPQNVIIILDDISLPVGKIRIRKKGSHGGQNGMRNIIDLCGTDKFTRIKIGIGEKPDERWDLASWVLSRFSEPEKEILDNALVSVKKTVELIIDGNIDKAMNNYN